MLQYERIDISEGIEFDKTNKSVECMICHYWYFKDIGFKYQLYVCNGCHEIEIEMIKKAGSKFDDYSILPKIKQILLHWCYELTKSDL